MRLAKELKAQKGIEAAQEPQSSKRGGKTARGHGGVRIAWFRLARRQKFKTEEADLDSLTQAMTFMTMSGTFPAIVINLLT